MDMTMKMTMTLRQREKREKINKLLLKGVYNMTDAGYQIYHPSSPSKRYDFDKGAGGGIPTVSTGQEENRLELKTFGSRPYVYYAGHTDYATFDLNGVFVTEYGDDGHTIVKRAKTIFEEFKSLLRHREPLIVVNSMGDRYICDVSLNPTSTPLLYTDRDMDFIEVSVKCTEIDE